MSEKIVKVIIAIIVIVILVTGIYLILKQRKEVLKIGFLGDSITEFGWIEPEGYVRQIEEKIKSRGRKIVIIPAGIRGNTSLDMLKRMDKDILEKSPDVIFFMGGINDIWRNKGKKDEYAANIRKIIKRAKESNIELVIMNLTLISEDFDNPKNKEIEKYNKILKEITEAEKIQLIDLNRPLKEAIEKSGKEGNEVTIDGVHMNEKGNRIIAETIIKEYFNNKKD